MEKVQLDIVALSHSITQSQSYAVVLGEVDGNRRLPIVIGSFEAQAIAVAIERMTPSRPLTHDLMRSLFEEFNIHLKEVIVNNLVDGIFYAKLICDKEGKDIEIDSRTSDAIALAVRMDAPIYTYEFILDSAGIVLMEDESEELAKTKPIPKPKKEHSGFADISTEKLKELLDQAIADEDYEKAARLRDELNSRS